jgi:DNA-binding transcriptional LysR family regulator
MSDIAEYCYLAALLGRLRQVAPGVRVAVVRLEPATIEASLRTGEVDLALGYLPDLSGCTGEQVLVDGFVGLIRAGHPFADDHLDAGNLAGLEYVRIDSGAPGHQMAERYLDQLGLQRQIGLRLAHITVTPEIIRQTDFAIIYPRSMAERINGARAFRILPLRLEMPRIEIRVHTHARASADPGIQWFSRMLTEVCQA